MTDDQQLLKNYVRDGSRAALEELVRRHLALVYSSALRQVLDPHMAEDVTQAVFLVLAQRAKTVREGMAIGGWLLAVTRHAAINILKKRATEQRHQRMLAQSTTTEPTAAAWEEITPHLDAQLNALPSADRDALVLRFFQNRTFSQIADELHVSEDAAQKRVSRALVRLRTRLGRRGITLPAAAIATAIGVHSIQAAPAHLLSVTLAATSGTTATIGSASLAKGVIAMIAWTKFKSAIVVGLAAIFLSVATFEIAYVAFKPSTPVPSAAPASVEDTQPAFIVSGVVVDAAGQPVANVAVEHPINGGGVLTARSSADGKFVMKAEENVHRFGGYIATSTDGTKMAYAPYVPEEGGGGGELHLVLRPARTLPVHTRDDTGAPVAGALVVAFSNFDPLARTQSDASGEATLRFPADAGLQAVTAFKSNVGLDYAMFWGKGEVRNDPFRLDAGTTAELTFTLNGAKNVKVHVVDDKNLPLAGASVTPWYFSKPRKGDDLNVSLTEFKRTTDAQGNAAFDFIPLDNQLGITFWVTKDGFTAPTRFVYDPKEASTDLTAMLLRKIPIVGRVVDEQDQPVAGATVRVGGAGYSIDTFRASATTAADGTYMVEVDPNMFYGLYAQKDHRVSDCRSRVLLTEAPQPIKLTLYEGRHIKGRVTSGPEHAPVANNYVELEFLNGTYHDLPKEQQILPNADNHSLMAFISQSTKTDADGNYEFFGPPGAYYARTSISTEEVVQNFTLVEEAEKQVDLHSKAVANLPKQRSGRVVRADKPDEGVPEVVLGSSFFDSDAPGRSPDGVADKEGKFTFRAASQDYYVYASTPDRKWGGLRLVRADEEPIVITVAPTASVAGRLVDDKGRPLADFKIVWSTNVRTKVGGFTTYGSVLGGITQTDKDGKFSADGMLVGRVYDICTSKRDSFGSEHSDQKITSITPGEAVLRNLGDLRVVVGPVVPAG